MVGVSSSATVALIDAHVHYYPFCSFSSFFDAAWCNFSVFASEVAPGEDFISVICLLETAGSNWFQLLSDPEQNVSLGSWRVDLNYTDKGYLLILGSSGQCMLIMPGRQLISSENIEVLVLGMQHYCAYDSTRSYLEQFSNQYPVILPWGVGKWLGERGRIVEELIKKRDKYQFYLGDNSGRPRVWSNIPQFLLASGRSIPVLPGSDPLPVKGQYKKTGSYGFVLRGSSAVRSILDSPIEALKNVSCPIEAYGALDSVGNFFYSQIRMRIQPLKASEIVNSNEQK